MLRFDPLGELEGRVTLMDASQRAFGVSKPPYFDLQNSSLIFSFGSRFDESWLLPRSVDLRSSRSPGGQVGRQAYLVHFDESGQPAAWADEWIQIRPGSQACWPNAGLSGCSSKRRVALLYVCEVPTWIGSEATGVTVASYGAWRGCSTGRSVR